METNDANNIEGKLDKNDHRSIGKEYGLFTFSDTVGKGLPLYTEKGAAIRRELERFVVDLEVKRGYKHVITPDIAKLDLYKKSGHYPYYKDTMYAPITIDEEEFMLRPMTCPHHFELYLSKPHSYRELPMRIAEIAKLYRYEASGNLSGLVRVRSFCLADSHIICADDEQAKDEVKNVLDLIEEVAGTFGLKKGEDFWYRLSLGDRNDDKKYYKDDAAWEKSEGILREVLQGQGVKFNEAKDEVKNVLDLIEEVAGTFGLKKGEDFWYRLSLGDRNDDKKYYKDDAAWEKSEGILREVLQGQGVKFNEAKDEAAFYGPKIDIQMKDVRGIENTAFTVQYDFVMPKRFNLTYVGKDGTEQQAVVVHRSSIGAIERVMAFIIEHYKGSFPLWLSPVQVKVIPVREQHNAKAEEIYKVFLENGIRTELLNEDENLGTKVRKAKEDKTNYWIVLGDKEIEKNMVTLESRDNGNLGQMSLEDALKRIVEEIKNKA
jgi:threonyl-tRNA synthetase